MSESINTQEVESPMASALRQGLMLIVSTSMSAGLTPRELTAVCGELLFAAASSAAGSSVLNGGSVTVSRESGEQAQIVVQLNFETQAEENEPSP